MVLTNIRNSVFIENDARSALLGEWKYGNAKDADNVILMTLGTGIGSAAVTEGRLLEANTLRQVSWADTLLSIIKAAFVIAEIRAA